jgi:hypothetical protein
MPIGGCVSAARVQADGFAGMPRDLAFKAMNERSTALNIPPVGTRDEISPPTSNFTATRNDSTPNSATKSHAKSVTSTSNPVRQREITH